MNNSAQMLSQPPPMTRMADGSYAPAQVNFGHEPSPDRKFLIVLQYYNGDIDAVEDLAGIIADLERVRNSTTNILIFGRHDARPFPADAISRLRSKFGTVHVAICRNRDSNTYPFATNDMFYDLVTLLGQYPQWRDNYYAFINMESDSVPMHPGWIKELTDDFRQANLRNIQCIGHIQEKPSRHLNGLAIYAIDIFQRVPGGKLGGGRPDIAYDIFHAPNLLPLAEDTPRIMFNFRRPTITADDLFGPHKRGVEPAIYHGVKDDSARQAVKAKHITFSGQKDLSESTVFAYFGTRSDLGHGETDEIVEAWRVAWKSRGWNPIILRPMEAAGNKHNIELLAALEKLPWQGERQDQKNSFLRWAALQSMGGGLLVDLDMLPTAFTPAEFDGKARWSRSALEKLIKGFIDYTLQPDDLLEGKPHVTDITIINRLNKTTAQPGLEVVEAGQPEWRSAPVVKFSDAVLGRDPWRGMRKVQAMMQFLRGG